MERGKQTVILVDTNTIIKHVSSGRSSNRGISKLMRLRK